jgi:hypothetical protein
LDAARARTAARIAESVTASTVSARLREDARAVHAASGGLTACGSLAPVLAPGYRVTCHWCIRELSLPPGSIRQPSEWPEAKQQRWQRRRAALAAERRNLLPISRRQAPRTRALGDGEDQDHDPGPAPRWQSLHAGGLFKQGTLTAQLISLVMPMCRGVVT